MLGQNIAKVIVLTAILVVKMIVFGIRFVGKAVWALVQKHPKTQLTVAAIIVLAITGFRMTAGDIRGFVGNFPGSLALGSSVSTTQVVDMPQETPTFPVVKTQVPEVQKTPEPAITPVVIVKEVPVEHIVERVVEIPVDRVVERVVVVHDPAPPAPQPPCTGWNHVSSVSPNDTGWNWQVGSMDGPTVVLLWTNLPGHDQREYRLYLAQGQIRYLAAGGTQITLSCEAEALNRFDYEANFNYNGPREYRPIVTLEDLERWHLVNH